MDSLINTMHIFIVKRGKVKSTKGLQLSIRTIQDVPLETGYKYLGILRTEENLLTEVKYGATSLYLKRVKQVLKSKLSGPHKIQAINTYGVSVISYTAGILPWTETEVAELYRKKERYIQCMEHSTQTKMLTGCIS